MARYIKIHSAVINLDEIRHAHFNEHPTDPGLVIDLGGKPFELDGPAARRVWDKLLVALNPEEWLIEHQA